MAATEQSMMEVIIENKKDCEREQELYGEPTMMCLDDFQGDGQNDGQGVGQDDGQGNGQDDGQGAGQDDGQGDGQDDGQGDGQDDNKEENDGEDDCQAKILISEQSGPVHERCVHGEINEIWVPLDRNEVLFMIAQPYEPVPLSRYFLRECEWPLAAHFFRAALEAEDEEFDDWSPSRSPSIRNVGV